MEHKKLLEMTPEERIAYRNQCMREHYKNKELFQVGDNDIEYPLVKDVELQKWLEDRFIELGAIPKEKLIVGKWYLGGCRNADRAMWKGENFEYDRYKFGSTFKEKIKHFQDDDGFDVFVPIKEIE